MILGYKSLGLYFCLFIITAGCYTTRQHPLVLLEDDIEPESLVVIDFQDRCGDCHYENDTLNLTSVSIPSLIQIHKYNSDYYSDNESVNQYYNSVPWWTEYDWSNQIEDDFAPLAVVNTILRLPRVPPIIDIPLPVPNPIIIEPVVEKVRTNGGAGTQNQRPSSDGSENRNRDGGRTGNNGRR
jgi:hypothetical protein